MNKLEPLAPGIDAEIELGKRIIYLDTREVLRITSVTSNISRASLIPREFVASGDTFSRRFKVEEHGEIWCFADLREASIMYFGGVLEPKPPKCANCYDTGREVLLSGETAHCPCMEPSFNQVLRASGFSVHDLTKPPAAHDLKIEPATSARPRRRQDGDRDDVFEKGEEKARASDEKKQSAGAWVEEEK